MIEKIILGTEQLTRTENKTTLVNVKFSLNVCKNLTMKNELNDFNTARDFFSILFSLLEISLNSMTLEIYG